MRNKINWNEIFVYDNGVLYWRISPCPKIRPGNLAGCEGTQGYWQLCYKKQAYLRHRVVYEMFHGDIPPDTVIRHINNIAGDDRIENLAIGTKNLNNKDKIGSNKRYKNNKSGVSGVRFRERDQRWIVHGGSSSSSGNYLGSYVDFFEAVCARKSWEAKRLQNSTKC